MKLMDLTTRFVTVIVFLFLWSVISEAQKLIPFNAQYVPFNDSQRTTFEVVDPATINQGTLQVTPDSAAGNVDLRHKSGRVMLRQSFELWDKSGRLASFESSFLINIFPINGTPGEGLTFLIAPDLKHPPNSSDEYLGLTNLATDGNSTNRLVAVEFDTVKQDFDPDANHIGLNINSVRSTTTVSLTPFGIELCPVLTPPKAKFHNVWVNYNGFSKTIEVYIAEQQNDTDPTPPKPDTPVMKTNLDLRDVANQYSYFGFSASTGNLTQLNVVLRWNLTQESDRFESEDNKSKDSKKGLNIGLVAGISIPVIVLLAGAGMGYFVRKKQPAEVDLLGMPREFRFRDLKKATNNFNEKNKLGNGGFGGGVYKGVLPKENLVVAVKMLSIESIKGKDDFLAELRIINSIHHRHIVRLLGWCHKNGKLLLVYDYMQNGSLDKHLFGQPDSEPLKWELRYRILSGVASALHYLHDEYDQRVQCDIKASNIMLDSNFNAQLGDLGDFGLTRSLGNEKTTFVGTFGYIAPECCFTGKATQQSDTYALGVALMEVVCGLRPGTKIGNFQFIEDWVWSLHQEGHVLDAVDKRLGDEFVSEEAERLLLLGLACSHPIASERPKIQAIVQIISGSLPVPNVPPFKPAFVPSMPIAYGR